MATNALATGLEAQAAVRNSQLRVESRVALQAELAGFAAHQKHAIGAAVRIVTGDAALHFHRGMLEYKGSAFFNVAVHTGLQRGFVQTGQVLSAMRIVTVGTLHQPLWNAVMHRQGELRLNGQVARKAECRFRLLQETVMQPAGFVSKPRQLKKIPLRIAQIPFAVVFHFVNEMRGMALIAGDAVASVFGVFEKLLLFAGDVAGKAARGVFRWGTMKGEDRMVGERLGCSGVVAVRGLDSVGVGFGRTMTTFAAVNVVLAGKD